MQHPVCYLKMARFQRTTLGVFFLFFVHYSHAGLVSTPFDNFHIECPQNAGVQRLSIRMVESQGMKRQDTVFSISCNSINEVYPWNGIPDELAALEREECHYSSAFDPIMDTNSELSCGPREYIASIVRLYGTKIQIGCCKLRTRDERNCVVQRFGKPVGISIRSEIENRAMLVNSISVDGDYFHVRFCDLTPRAAGLIEEDAKKAALKTTTTSTTQISTTSEKSTTTVPVQTTQTVAETSESVTDTTSPKRVIKVKPQKTANQTTTSEQQINNINLPTILQPVQPAENVENNEIVNSSIQRSLHGTSIVDGPVAHKAKDAPQGLAKIAANDSAIETTTVEAEVTTDSTTISIEQSTTVELKTSEPTTIPIEQSTTVEATTEQTDSTTVETTQQESTTQQETTTQQESTTQQEVEITTIPIEQSTTVEVTTESSSTTQSIQTTKKVNPSTKAITEATTEVTTQESSSSSTTTEQLHPQFVATDGRDTETMFPKMSISDYDDDEEQMSSEDAKAEADKIMKSIMQMMDTQKEIKKLAEELKEKNKQSEESTSTTTQKVTDNEIKISEVTESSVLIVARKDKKQMSDGQTKMDVNKPEKPEKRVEFVQADQKPLAVENTDGAQKKLDEFIDKAPFDFSAFPHPPENSESAKQAVELPRYTRLQTKATTKLFLPVITTTKEPEFLIADRLDEIPEPINLKPRRNFASRTLRRRPVSHYPDEETNSSPFDDRDELSHSSNGRQRKTDSGFAEEHLNNHDLFDRESSNEQASEGRFSLPTDSRFSQRSPFEVRRAPIPHLKEPYYSFDILAEKYDIKAQKPQSVDILFESASEELLPTTAQTSSPSSISHRDAERYFHPADNKPMNVPEPSTFVNNDPPTKLTFLRKKQNPVKTKQPLPNMSNQLVPMSEPSSSATVALPPLVPVTRARPTTESSTTVEYSTTIKPSTEVTTETPTTFQPSTEDTTELFTTTESSATFQPSTEATTELFTTTESSTTFQPSTETTIITESTVVTERQTEPLVEQTPDPTTKVYNPLDFYHTLPPRRQFIREKILTFCSKDTAIRDENHMVIACGTETEAWVPNRCPEGTDCFVSSDSLYRICCHVSNN